MGFFSAIGGILGRINDMNIKKEEHQTLMLCAIRK